MSSTNRSDREGTDDYPTPPWCVARLLEAINLPRGRWYEPCAGAGSIIKAVSSSQITPATRWWANEIAPEYKDVLTRLPHVQRVFANDARDPRARAFTAAVVITNPPFNIAQEILENFLGSSSLVIFLQRLNWCAGPRRDLFRKHRPSVYVLPDRPSFTGAGTDSIEYAWFVFDGKATFQVLNDTSKQERSNAAKQARAETIRRAAAQDGAGADERLGEELLPRHSNRARALMGEKLYAEARRTRSR